MKKLFIFLIIGMFILLPLVEGMAWDNKKTFDKKVSKYGKIKIYNSIFLGLGTGEQLADYTLLKNTDQCLINCFAEGTATLYKKDKLFSDLKFKSRDNKFKNLKSNKIFIKVNQSYQEEVNKYYYYNTTSKNGTITQKSNLISSYNITRYREVWQKYNFQTLKKGTYSWRIEAKKSKGESIDWIGSAFGKDLTEWAWWNTNWLYKRTISNLNGNISYLNLSYNSNMNADFSDLRFLDSTETIELNYTISDKSDSNWVRIRVNNLGANSIYMYYGDSVAITTGSASDVYFNPVSMYYLDEQSGTIAIDAVGTNNGTNTNVNVGVPGYINSSYSVEVTSYIVFDNPIVPTSINGWFYFNSTTNTFFFDASNNYAFEFNLNTINIWDGSSNNFGVAPNINEWVMLTFVYDGSNYNLYFNGTFVASKTLAKLSIEEIGRQASSTSPGYRDEISFYNYSLTQDQITALYNQTSPLYILGAEKKIDPQVTLNSPSDSAILTNQNITFNGSVFSANTILNVSLILDGIYNETNTSGVNNTDYLFTKIVSDGSHNWTYKACNNSQCKTATLRTFSLDSILPQINISAPTGVSNYFIIGQNETLNVTFTDTNLDSCWYNYNGTNITIPGCLTGVLNSTNFILETGNTNLTAYSNDTAGNENSSFVNWSYTYFENNRTLNNESFQTEGESFNINIVGPTSASLFYNGTEYTTTKTGNNFNRTIQIPIANLGNNSVYWKFDGVNNSYTSYQNVTETIFTLCNSTYQTTFLNISFKDESDSSIINASIPTSTFEYWLGDGTITKTYTLINNTDNFNYTFCATPNRTLNVDPIIQYKQGTAYPQRTWDPSAQQYTNTTTNQILYLLNVANGLYVTFQVINIALQPINNVIVSATRTIESVTTSVAQGTTDAAGAVTFWLNPDFKHTLTFTKTGYDVLTNILFPTQSTYTVTLGGTATTEPDQTRGVSTVVKPQDSFLLNDTSYNFNYTISSTYWNLDDFGFNLTYSNGTVINSQSSTASSGGTLSTTANTLNSSWIRMNYYYLINTTYTNYTRIWYIQNTQYTEYSISNFFERFTLYINAGMFGFDDFGKALISFLILVLVSGGLSFRYGLQSEVAIMGIIFGLVLVLDVGLGLIPNPQLATQAGIENIITVITGILLFGMLVKEELR